MIDSLLQLEGRWRGAREPGSIVRSLMVLASCDSTQDVAGAYSPPEGGLLVTTLRQEHGRGRLGRRWIDEPGMSLAVTLVLDASQASNARLSLLGGVAACRCVERFAGAAWLRWPNDVLAGPEVRKCAGVLVERRGSLALLGVGINVMQRTENDFAHDLRGQACSLSMLAGKDVERADVCLELIRCLDMTYALTDMQLVEQWSGRELLIGRRCTFIFDNHHYTGLVHAIDPTGNIVIELDGGGEAHLPALQTSLNHLM